MLFMTSSFDINDHRSEFENREPPSFISDALLSKEKRPPRDELDPYRNHNQHRKPQRQTNEDACDIEYAFPPRNLIKNSNSPSVSRNPRVTAVS